MAAAFRRSRAAETSRQRTRLPWWAPALAVISFTALLAFVAGSPAASAASARQGLGPLLEFLAGLVLGGVR
ncbi:hypothetical protein ACWC9R_27820 [Streptomyces sp. NPDC001219]